MNLRHAAALALVGWYLMMPPTLAMDSNRADLSAPLAKWIAHEEMDTLSKCEHRRKQEIVLEHNPYSLYQQYIEAENSGGPEGSVFSIPKLQESADAQKCIAIDDPRLKGDHDPDLRDTGQ